MAARFPSGPPLKLATDSTLGAVGSTGTGGYPGADAGKKGGPRVGAGRAPNVFYNTGHGHLGWTLSALTADSIAAIIDDAATEKQGPTTVNNG